MKPFWQRSALWLIAINTIAITFYFFIVLKLGFPESLRETTFYGLDSNEYMAMGEWIFGNPAVSCSDTRPFLFPALIKLFSIFGGELGIWFMHFSLWLVSLNLVFLSIKKMLNAYWAAVAFCVMLINLSFIIYTMHALTEIVTIFLLSYFVWFSTSWHNRTNEPGFWCRLIFITSLAAVVKPLFSVALYLVLLCFIIFLIRKRTLFKRRTFFLLAISLLPVIIQLSIMGVQFGKFTISTIGSVGVRNYFYAKYFADINNIPFPLDGGPTEKDRNYVLSQIDSLSVTDIGKSLSEYPGTALKTYLNILHLNFNYECTIIDWNKYTELAVWTLKTNKNYLKLHMVMLFLLPLTIYLYRKNKDFIIYSSLLLIPLLIIISSSGINYWQGDRYLLVGLPLWSALYTFTLLKLFTHLLGAFKKSK